MSRIVYLDCPCGIAGDMLLAALIDAGADREYLKEKLAQLPLEGWSLEPKPVCRCGIQGLHLDLGCQTEHHHRTWRMIKTMLEEMDWPAAAKENALRIFSLLAEAEAKVHGCEAEEVHFHEVGAADSILDICGAALAFHQLGIEKLYCSPLPLSHGWVECAHGRIPLPAPAAALLMEGMELTHSSFDTETVTPTGIAILKGMNALCSAPDFCLQAIGMGAGTKDIPNAPNILRAFIGEEKDCALLTDKVEVLRTNIDDSSGELLGQLWQQAFATGALDMSYTPLIMKKGRPGWALELIAPQGKGQEMAKLIFAHTTAIGLRISTEARIKLERSMVKVKTPYGNIELKISGNTAAPEAEQVAAAAAEHQTDFKTVYNAVIAAYAEL